MRHVEGFTDRDLVGLTAHPSTLRDPLIGEFLDIWRSEESVHAATLGRFLGAYDECHHIDVPARQLPSPAVASRFERALARVVPVVGPVVTTAHMAWGAANELLTLNGYHLLAARCGLSVRVVARLRRFEDRPTGGGRTGRVMRQHVNRVIVSLALAFLLPLIAAAEKIRRGSGRRVAVVSAGVVARACGVRFDVRGAERLAVGRCVVVANHHSPLDVVALLLANADLRFVAAAELFRLPLLGSAMRALGTRPLHRTNATAARRELEGFGETLMHDSLVLFPEGGIAPDGELLPFKSGAFLLAIIAGVPVVPVALTGTADALGRGSRLGLRPAVVTVQVPAPISTARLVNGDRKQLRDGTREAIAGALVAT